MRRNLCVFALLAVIAAVLPSTAHAGSTVQHFKGISATVSFVSFDSTGCVGTFADLFVIDELTRTPGNAEATSRALLSVVQYDTCLNVFLGDLSGSADLPPEAFDTRGKLHGARLAASMEVTDFQTGATVPVSIDLVWTAVGDVVRGSSSFRSVYPNQRISFRQMGSSTMADVAGTLLVGGVERASQPADFGILTENQTGSVTITR
ncbi:MAG: hypothetical protein ABUT39_29500 [Acidobacteriota bacterium]